MKTEHFLVFLVQRNMKPNKDLRRDEVVSAIRADVFGVCFRYRQFCRSLDLFACERSYQTKLRESDFKKEQTLPRREGGGGFGGGRV